MFMTCQLINYLPAYQTKLKSFLSEIITDMSKVELYPKTKYADMDDIESNYQSKSGMFQLLVCESNIIGTVAVRNLGHKIAELKRLFLLRQHRGKGYGKKMLDTAIKHVVNHNFIRLRLDTTSKSAAAINLFEKTGFSYIEKYNDNPDAEYFMELVLSR